MLAGFFKKIAKIDRVLFAIRHLKPLPNVASSPLVGEDGGEGDHFLTKMLTHLKKSHISSYDVLLNHRATNSMNNNAISSFLVPLRAH